MVLIETNVHLQNILLFRVTIQSMKEFRMHTIKHAFQKNAGVSGRNKQRHISSQK